MNNSKLSEQVIRKGRVMSPLVAGLGDILELSSWSVERLPEYIWLALILDAKGRSVGTECCTTIFRKIKSYYPNFNSAKLSLILELGNKHQNDMFDVILSEIEPKILAPLTVVIDYEYCPTFYKRFYVPGFSLEDRIKVLSSVTRKYNQPDSNEATDIRYLAIIPAVLSGHLHFPQESPVTDALLYYGNTPHDKEIMRVYRPSIRSLEGVSIPDKIISNWVNKFWEIMSSITDCKLLSISYKKDDAKVDYNTFIAQTKEALDYLNIQHKQDTTQDDAYSVLTGSLVYAFKTFMEVVEHDLANTLIGRQSTRIIIEIYIMMKYLCDKEAEKPTIWSEYKAYGIGKYKLILLKMREGMGSDTNHVSEKMLDMLVNEPQLEEFTDVDLRYFDDVKIRDKAISVGEKDLYDVAYDYDSSYAHGLWGAVRESCMLVCDNVFHHFRPVADASLSQNLPDITEDCFNYLVRLILLVNERYSFPEWYIASLEKHHE